MLVSGRNIDMVIPRKTVHKRVDLTSCTLINELIDERCGEIILRTGAVDVTVINIDLDGTLLFIHRDYIRNLIRKWNGVNETSLEKLFDFGFNGCSLSRVHGA